MPTNYKQERTNADIFRDIDDLIGSIIGDYVSTDGLTPLTGDWDVGGFDLEGIVDLDIIGDLTIDAVGQDASMIMSGSGAYTGTITFDSAADEFIIDKDFDINGNLAAEMATFRSPDFPVVEIIRDSTTNGSALFGGATLQREMNSGVAVDGSGLGFYFKSQNDNDEIIPVGIFGAVFTDISDGAEIGTIIMAPSWHGESDASMAGRSDFTITATSANTANASIKGDINADGFGYTGDNLLIGKDADTTLVAQERVHVIGVLENSPAGDTFIAIHSPDSDSGTLAGIKFSTTVVQPTLIAKSMIVHQESSGTPAWGYGDLVFCVDSVADQSTVDINDEVMRITGTGILITGDLTVGAYTLPATDGTAGQVLQTNGSGVLTWVTP